MDKLKKLLFAMLLLLVGGIMVAPASAFAATISYKYIDGTAVQSGGANYTTDNSAANFDAVKAVVNAEIGTGKIIAYVDGSAMYKGVLAPNEFAADGTVVVVTSDKATGGKLNDAHDYGVVWFIYDDALYLVSQKAGGSRLQNSGSYYDIGTINREVNFDSDGFFIKTPSMEKTDPGVDGYGVEPSVVGDESTTINDDEYYEYTGVAPAEKELSVTAGETINFNEASGVFKKMATSAASSAGDVMDAGTFPWISYAADITDVYMGTDIIAEGNLAQMFNGNTSPNGSRVSTIELGKVGESKYTNLENVYIYSSFEDVTTTAAMFARCPSLRQVIAYQADGTEATTFDLTKNKSTAFMFYGCEALENNYTGALVDIMDMSTGELKDTRFMFAGCPAITSPKIKDYDMSNVDCMDSMFHGATDARITFSGSGNTSVAGWNVGNVRSCMAAFAGVLNDLDDPVSNLSPGLSGVIPTNTVVDGAVDLGAWDLSNCVTAYGMFAQNLGVSDVSFNTAAGAYAQLRNAENMFNGCDYISSVSMPVEMPELTDAKAMYRRAASKYAGTASANLDGWKAPKLHNADMMFEASGFTTIDLDSSSDMSSVTEMKAMFADNVKLTNLGADKLGHWVLSDAEEVGYMFSGCTSLEDVDVATWGMDSAKDITHMFCDCESLGAINASAWTTPALTGMECFAYNTGITSASMEGWDTSNVTNMYMAYSNCPNLATVVLPGTADSFAKVKYTTGMFAFDPVLEEVTGADTSKYAAPDLIDARGMYAFCPSLTTVDTEALVKDKTETIAYMFRGDESLTGADISLWDTSNVTYMQGLFDGCVNLQTVSVGDDISSAKLQDMGMMFRNCYKLGDSINTVLAKFAATPLLKDMYQSFKNCYALMVLDMSDMNLSVATDLREMAYMEEHPTIVTNKLTTIKVPATITTAPGFITTNGPDGHGGTSINMFWVDGDGASDGGHEESSGTDDLKTTFIVNGAIPAGLKSYNFGGTNGDNDNRSFLSYDPANDQTINGTKTNAYTFISPTDVGVLKMSVTSTLYKNGKNVTDATNVPAEFVWQKDSTPVAGTTDTYTTAANAAGVYKATAVPGELTGGNREFNATYTLSAFPVVAKKIEATYKGTNIVQGNSYSKNDVEVKYTDAGGVEHTLAPADFTVNSLVVSNLGDNTYTVTYNPGDGDLTDTITVRGVAAGEPYITATYTGLPITVGNNYTKLDVDVKYTTAGGTTTTLGVNDFTVNKNTVEAVGDNTFTATYVDPDGKTLTDTFTVEGKDASVGIVALYIGDDVPVGQNYSKDDVKVTYTTPGGVEIILTSDDFTVNSQKVTKKGDNTFTVTYKLGDDTYTDTITVPGKRVIGSIKAVYTGPSVLVGNEYNPSDVTVTAYYSDDVSKSEGFTVNPSGFSTTKVTNVGSNNVTATYKDPAQGDKAFTSVFTVTGYKNVSSISATYTGDKIKVGKSYDKDKVKVTVYYDDGTSGTTTAFTVDSTTVTGEGSNSYTATYRDAFGNTYTAGYTVPGYKDGDSGSGSSSSSSAWPGTSGSDYAGVSSVLPGFGTGYAASTPIGYNLGVASGLVQTGTTDKAVFFIVGGIVLICALAILLYIKFLKSSSGDGE